MPPLWLTMATGPSCGVASRNMVEKLSTAPLAKLASPCELGPITRMPVSRAMLRHAPLLGLRIGRCRLAESGRHDDGNLDADSAHTPPPHCSARSPGTTMTATSGTSGNAARLG